MEAGAEQPPRSVAAQPAQGAAAEARARQAQPSGWWGMVLFLCAEGTLFGILISTYFYLDFGSKSWPPDGIAPPSVALPLIATAALVATTVPLALAARAARRGLRWQVVWLIAGAIVVQLCYLAVQILLFATICSGSRRRRPRTARSTSRCSPRITPTWCSGSCSSSPCYGRWSGAG